MRAWGFSYEDQEHDTISIATDAELNTFLDYQASIGKCGVIRISRKMRPQKMAKLADKMETNKAVSSSPKPVTRVPLTKLVRSMKPLCKAILVPSSKYVRLEINNDARKKNGKSGNYLGVSKCGKLMCHAGKGRHGIWTLNKTTDGDLTLSPLDHPSRYLRMLPSGKVNLNNSKPGKWARWSFTKEKSDSVSLEGLKEIQLFSVANPGKVLSIVQVSHLSNSSYPVCSIPLTQRPYLQKKESEKLTACGCEIGAPEVIKCSFPVETIEAIDVLRIQAKQMSLEKNTAASDENMKKQQHLEKKHMIKRGGMLAHPRLVKSPISVTPPTIVASSSAPSTSVPAAAPKCRGAPFVMRGPHFARGGPQAVEVRYSPFLLRGAPIVISRVAPNSPNTAQQN